ncbi:MAG: cytochrome c, partial [Gammaproteobacteria bacterium]|nr:cytochrome c [Gammaproteobacteria bacterium]
MSSGWNSTEGHRAVAMLVTLLWVSGVAAQEPPVEVASGEGLYEQLCASCHGSEGHGDGTVSHDVLLRPRDFALNAF